MKVIVTGSSGFIGCHVCATLLAQGHAVFGIDNLSRPGSEVNLEWLRSLRGRFTFAPIDIRSVDDLFQVFALHKDADLVIHEAAQVAVTTSVSDPRLDFTVNALGTFNTLEAARRYCPKAAFLFASTNKVYGGMGGLEILERPTRYVYAACRDGVSEEQVLDFHSPYGCSKGAADQYVRDYSRIYGLRTVVFRQSCIYGTRQFGFEDQGWVAWFSIAAVAGWPISIYGDGKQVRDVLWVEDLVNLYLTAVDKIEVAAGRIYNVGGGETNALSILELLDLLERYTEKSIQYSFEDWRPGDQRVYVSDCRKAHEELGWAPRVQPFEGVRRLVAWASESSSLLQRILRPSAAALAAKAVDV
ncbi:MAG: GDP-mannose 4,6-dehydratase [Planctomycetota bacterium]